MGSLGLGDARVDELAASESFVGSVPVSDAFLA
jgi:hypothetical protein